MRRRGPGTIPGPSGLDQDLGTLSDDEIVTLDACWRAANYLTIGQIHLHANLLEREPLSPEHIKPRLLGHWGTSPGLPAGDP